MKHVHDQAAKVLCLIASKYQVGTVLSGKKIAKACQMNFEAYLDVTSFLEPIGDMKYVVRCFNPADCQ